MSSAVAARWALPTRPRDRPFELGDVDGLFVNVLQSRGRTATFFDTDDRRLTRWGCELARNTDEGWILRLPDAEHTGPQRVGRVLRRAAGDRDVPADIADLLTALTRGKPLRPVLRARIDEVTSAVSERGARGAVEVLDSRAVALDGRRIAGRFHHVHVSAVRDGAASRRVVAAVGDALRQAGGVDDEDVPMVRRILAADAHTDPDVVVHEATDHGPASDAVQRALAASVLRLLMHDAAVRAGTDPEGVHQARVATRRLRSDLRTFRPLLDEAWTRTLRDDLHRLADLLGAVRDADVLLARLEAVTAQLPAGDHRPARHALASLRSDRNAARTALLAEMRSGTYTRLLDELVDAAAHAPASPPAGGRASQLLPPLAKKPWRRLQARVGELGAEPSAAELHEVRILAKRARYAAEAVAPVSRRSVARFARAVAAVQDALGEHHDATVAEAWLRTAVERGSSPLVMGELIGLERAAAAAAAAKWPGLWQATLAALPKGWS